MRITGLVLLPRATGQKTAFNEISNIHPFFDEEIVCFAIFFPKERKFYILTNIGGQGRKLNTFLRTYYETFHQYCAQTRISISIFACHFNSKLKLIQYLLALRYFPETLGRDRSRYSTSSIGIVDNGKKSFSCQSSQ